MIGRRFGKITVIKDSGQRYKGHVVYECLCDCGEIKFLPSLRLGRVKSCGCSQHEKGILRVRTKASIRPSTTRKIGLKMNRLTIVDFKKELRKPLRVILLCDCGSTIEKGYGEFMKGRIKPCGCLRKEINANAKRAREEKANTPPKKYTYLLTNDLSGKVTKRVTILYWCGIRISKSGVKHPIWYCRCKCGKELVQTSQSILKELDGCGCTHYAKRKERALIQADQRKKKILSFLSDEWIPRDDIDHSNRRFRGISKSQMLIKHPNGCLICGHKGDKQNYICAHHLKTHSLFPKLRYLTINLIPLCKHCHDELHKELGFMNPSVASQLNYINNKQRQLCG